MLKQTSYNRALIDKANHAYRYWNYKEAYTYYKEVERLSTVPIGHVTYRLSLMYWDGLYVKKDRDKAKEYFALAHEQLMVDVEIGDAEAQCDLGYLYEKGFGVEPNGFLAAKYYKLSADQGYPLGQYNYGVMLRDGIGVPCNDLLAMKFFHLAADNGPAWAQFHLGFIYYNGFITKKDLNLAMKYFQSAADQGAARAQMHIANMYADGIGFKQDYKFAFKYWFLAYHQNHELHHRTVMDCLGQIFSGKINERYKLEGLEFISEEWPKLHVLLEHSCQNAIFELFLIFWNNFYLVVPQELVVLMVRAVIRLWPGEHCQKLGEAGEMTGEPDFSVIQI